MTPGRSRASILAAVDTQPAARRICKCRGTEVISNPGTAATTVVIDFATAAAPTAAPAGPRHLLEVTAIAARCDR
jgi:hypothetical protein